LAILRPSGGSGKPKQSGLVDGIAERLRPGQRREAVLAAWGVGEDGRKVLLGLMAGSKEDVETVRAFFQDLRARGLGDPLLVVSDGAPGIIRAIEECFPRSARQRCLAHRMRNLAAKVPTDLWPEFKARVTACYQALFDSIRSRLRHLCCLHDPILFIKIGDLLFQFLHG
jgi:transposase-like protein